MLSMPGLRLMKCILCQIGNEQCYKKLEIFFFELVLTLTLTIKMLDVND